MERGIVRTSLFPAGIYLLEVIAGDLPARAERLEHGRTVESIAHEMRHLVLLHESVIGHDRTVQQARDDREIDQDRVPLGVERGRALLNPLEIDHRKRAPRGDARGRAFRRRARGPPAPLYVRDWKGEPLPPGSRIVSTELVDTDFCERARAAHAGPDVGLVGCVAAVGASFTGVTVIVNVCGGVVSTPPSAVPPSSLRTTVTSAVPVAFAAGVKFKERLPKKLTNGCT